MARGHTPVQRIRRWMRSIRGRLVVTYVLAAGVLALVGIGVFYFALTRGLSDNVDATLHDRASAVAAEVNAGVYTARITPAPRDEHHDHDIQSVTIVYSPTGVLMDAEPNPLPHDAANLGAAASAGQVEQISSAQVGGGTFRVLVRHVQRSDGAWTVVVGQSLGVAEQAESQIKIALAILLPVLLVAVGGGTWLLSGAALTPVDRMRRDAQQLSEHDSSGRITEPDTQDSLAHLARTFNGLLDRLHTSFDRQRSLVADAGHELRTPLAVLQTELETALRPTRTRADLVDSITHARVEVSRLATLAEDLLLLAQADGPRPLISPELTDVGDLVRSTVSAHTGPDGSIRGLSPGHGESVSIVVDVQGDEPLVGEVDAIAVRRMLDNLIANAVRYSPAAGTVTVRASSAPPNPDRDVEWLTLAVEDAGPGFPPEFIEQAFERFSRADQSRTRADPGAGSGLGLAIVETLVRAHHGQVQAGNAASGGAVVTILLPPAQQAYPSR